MVGKRVKFLGIGIFQPGHVPGKFNDGALHAKANAEERHALFPRVADGRNFALHPPVAETSGHQDAVTALKVPGGIGLGHIF